MREICTSGLMRGHWKRGMGEIVWHRRENQADNREDKRRPKPPRQCSTLRVPCKGAVLQWVKFPPGNWSLQPVAVEAEREGNDFR